MLIISIKIAVNCCNHKKENIFTVFAKFYDKQVEAELDFQAAVLS
jgi:hypothetical protein